MSFQICIKTNKSLQQLATEIRDLLALPPFKHNAFVGEPYCQFEMLGMLLLITRVEGEDREPEVFDYAYSFDMQMTFTDNDIDTDALEYGLQPYYAQLLAFRLGVDTAYIEKQKAGIHWKVRYRFYCKNPRWNEDILYGEPGWEPAVKVGPHSQWRAQLPLL